VYRDNFSEILPGGTPVPQGAQPWRSSDVPSRQALSYQSIASELAPTRSWHTSTEVASLAPLLRRLCGGAGIVKGEALDAPAGKTDISTGTD